MVFAQLPCEPLVVDPTAIGVSVLSSLLFYLYVASYRRRHLDLRGLLPRTVRRRKAIFRASQAILLFDIAKIAVGLVTLHVLLWIHELMDAAIRGDTASSAQPLAGGAYYLPSHAMRTLLDVPVAAGIATLFPWPLLVKWVGQTTRGRNVGDARSCCVNCRDSLRVPGRYSHSVLLGWDDEGCIDYRTEQDGADQESEPDSDVEVSDRLRLVRPVVRDAYAPQLSWWWAQTIAWCACLALTSAAVIVPQLILVAAARAGDPVSLFIRYVVPTSMATVVCGRESSLGVDWKEDTVLVAGSWTGMLVCHWVVDVCCVAGCIGCLSTGAALHMRSMGKTNLNSEEVHRMEQFQLPVENGINAHKFVKLSNIFLSR